MFRVRKTLEDNRAIRTPTSCYPQLLKFNADYYVPRQYIKVALYAARNRCGHRQFILASPPQPVVGDV